MASNWFCNLVNFNYNSSNLKSYFGLSLSGRFSSSNTLSLSFKMNVSLVFISSYRSFSFCFKLWIFSDFNLLFSSNSLFNNSHSLLWLIASFITETYLRIWDFSEIAFYKSFVKFSSFFSDSFLSFFNSYFVLLSSISLIPISVSNSDF